MCLILLAWRQHPRYPLVIAANRDETHARPSAAAHFWKDRADCLGGRDRLQGGSWLAVTRAGRFAAVTNYREGGPPISPALSRGWLVQDFVLGHDSTHDYLHEVEPRGDLYNGFGLIVGDGDGIGYLSNRGPGIRVFEAGIYGLSNHLLDSPWPKVTRGKATLAAALAAENTLDHAALLAMLADPTPAVDGTLPDTGVGLERERALSAIFVRGEQYGTRCSTVLTVDAGGTVVMTERCFDADGIATNTVTHRFTRADG